MKNDRDEANLMGQVAGIIAAMSAVIQAMPPAARKRVSKRMEVQFASLIEAMRTTGALEGDAGREGAEWVRDLFLRHIASADQKPAKKKPVQREPAETAVDIEF